MENNFKIYNYRFVVNETIVWMCLCYINQFISQETSKYEFDLLHLEVEFAMEVRCLR